LESCLWGWMTCKTGKTRLQLASMIGCC